MISCGRLLQSDRKPPLTPPNVASHSTIEIVDPAAVMVQPRSTSMVGPKLKIMAKPML